MAVRERAVIAASLNRKGFALNPGKPNPDHDYYHFQHPGLTTAVFTKISRGKEYKNYGDDLLGRMTKQLKLTTQQLLQLIDCTMDGDQYLKVLIKRGVIDEKKLVQKR